MKNVFKRIGILNRARSAKVPLLIAVLVAVIGFAVSASFAACENDVGTASLVPADPKGLKGSVSGNQVTLTWNAASGATSYEIEESDVSNFPGYGTGIRETTTAIRAVITLTSFDAISERLYFRVRARNSYGPSRGYSNVISVRIR